ncbi:MAG: head-tail adaptor protein [Rhodobacteraceae bacterium]|nr:MAG: head-tail adaptor protein [Paracoccaceae bacterium]
MSGATLTRRLTLEAAVETQDGAGGRVAAWRALGAVWAEVRGVSAFERFWGEAGGSRLSHRITVRWAPFGAAARPAAGQRFREGERLFAILGVTEADPHNRFLICWTEEGRAA